MSEESKFTDCYSCEIEMGKTIKSSKIKFVWKFNYSGKVHTIELFNSRISGKKKLIADGKMILSDHQITTGLFSFTFSLSELTMVIVQSGYSYELRINGFPFNHLKELEKNKRFFKENTNYTSITHKSAKPTSVTSRPYGLTLSEISPREEKKPAMFSFAIKPSSTKNESHAQSNFHGETSPVNKFNTKKLEEYYFKQGYNSVEGGEKKAQNSNLLLEIPERVSSPVKAANTINALNEIFESFSIERKDKEKATPVEISSKDLKVGNISSQLSSLYDTNIPNKKESDLGLNFQPRNDMSNFSFVRNDKSINMTSNIDNNKLNITPSNILNPSFLMPIEDKENANTTNMMKKNSIILPKDLTFEFVEDKKKFIAPHSTTTITNVLDEMDKNNKMYTNENNMYPSFSDVKLDSLIKLSASQIVNNPINIDREKVVFDLFN